MYCVPILFSLCICPILCDLTSLGKSANDENSYCSVETNDCGGTEVQTPPVLFDSVHMTWNSVDLDASNYLTQEELGAFVKSKSGIEDEDLLNATAQLYVNQLDLNGDTVVSKYELHYAIYDVLNPKKQESQLRYGESLSNFLRQNFVGESATETPLYLMKVFELFDEDINGKITWKEVRMTILMAEIFWDIPESERRDEPEREKLLPRIKIDNENKWLNMEEFVKLLEVLEVTSDKEYYDFLFEFLQDNSEYLSAPTNVKDEFVKTDIDLDGIISKGELIAALHKHRPGYYDDARINHRFSRADRNKDGQISFNEYFFLSNLKHPHKK